MFGFFRPQLGKENTTACDGGSASFNTAIVVALNHTTQGNVIRNSVISHISVHFPAWQLPEKSTEDQTVAERNAVIGESGRPTKIKASGVQTAQSVSGEGASTVAIFIFEHCLSLGDLMDLSSNEWGLSGKGQSGQFTNYCLVQTRGTL